MCPSPDKHATASPAESSLTPLDRAVLARIQGECPFSPDPYADLARELGSTPEAVHDSVVRLRQGGVIRRIGGSFAAGGVGYTSTLVAARVDPERIEAAAAVASAFPEVTHNYERNAAFNLWFTVIAADRRRLDAVLDAVRQAPGVHDLHDLPARRLFKIRVDFAFAEGPAESALPAAAATPEPVCAALDGTDRRAIRLACGDLGLDRYPFRAWAAELDVPEADLLARLAAYRQRGAMRRFGAVIRHHAAGFTANGMSVWDVPDADVGFVCERLAACPEISHCYERPRFPGWPYNVFGMIHGRSREECLSVAIRVAEQTGLSDYDVLFSVREFKKTSMIYFADSSFPPAADGAGATPAPSAAALAAEPVPAAPAKGTATGRKAQALAYYYYVERQVLESAKECGHDHACLSDPNVALCRILAYVDASPPFVGCLEQHPCPYKAERDGRTICSCPVRRRIFQRYGK
jgi:DNA-binding Lrp family transcriptional regulator